MDDIVDLGDVSEAPDRLTAWRHWLKAWPALIPALERDAALKVVLRDAVNTYHIDRRHLEAGDIHQF